MRAVIQRVSEASVSVEGESVGKMGRGLLILLGVEDADTADDGAWLARKAVNMRIFEDDDGKMNASLLDVAGQVMVVSQFTLHASTKKGNRPSFIRSAKPDHSEPLYLEFIEQIEKLTGKACAQGRFGANMQVSLVNSGPVTITMDSKARE